MPISSARRRIAVFLAALLVQTAAGAPPDGPPSRPWIEWIAAQPRRIIPLDPAKAGHARWSQILAASLTTVTLLRLPQQLLGRPARAPRLLAVLLHTLLFSTTFNLLGADRTAARIERALADNDLDTARTHCAALIGRPTGHFTDAQIADATIAALATYPSSALLGPWIAYALFDLPAAFAYRLADAVGAAWGGAGAWLPWRLLRLPGLGGQQRLVGLVTDQGTALVLVAAAPLLGHDPAPGLAAIDEAAEQDREINPDVAAMAGLLGLTLQADDGPINPAGRVPTPADIAPARRLARAVLVVLAAAVIVVIAIVTAVNRRRSDDR
jgi:cobalamin biosynthesis protein CobD/CbiB